MFRKFLAQFTEFAPTEESSKEIEKTDKKGGLIHSLYIPEPTRSLLFLTDDDTNLISSGVTINITFNINTGEINSDSKYNFHGEPSLIWTRLGIKPNSYLEKNPMYYPRYTSLTPEQRFQYLKWLEDITKPTNLSYVFLYYYGLERHLLLGDFDTAISEIKRLVSTQDPKLKRYINGPILMSIGMRNRLDVLPTLPFLFEGQDDLTLWIRHMSGHELKAIDIIKLAYQVGFNNRRYIKMYPETFEKILDTKIQEHIEKNGPLLGSINVTTLPTRDFDIFLNTSIPDEASRRKIPDFLRDTKFKTTLFNLLSSTHNQVKTHKIDSVV